MKMPRHFPEQEINYLLQCVRLKSNLQPLLTLSLNEDHNQTPKKVEDVEDVSTVSTKCKIFVGECQQLLCWL